MTNICYFERKMYDPFNYNVHFTWILQCKKKNFLLPTFFLKFVVIMLLINYLLVIIKRKTLMKSWGVLNNTSLKNVIHLNIIWEKLTNALKILI